MKQNQNKSIESKEGIFNSSIKIKTLVEFNGQTVSAAEYYPVWLNNLADDVTLEGSIKHLRAEVIFALLFSDLVAKRNKNISNGGN